MHAWRPELVEHVISRKFSLYCLEDISKSKEDTRTLNIWAWSTNPSSIAKVVWITFANRSEAPWAEVSSSLPDQWRRSLAFRVIIHLDYIEDHTAAPSMTSSLLRTPCPTDRSQLGSHGAWDLLMARQSPSKGTDNRRREERFRRNKTVMAIGAGTNPSTT